MLATLYNVALNLVLEGMVVKETLVINANKSVPNLTTTCSPGILQVLKIVLFMSKIEGRKVNLMIIEEKTKYVKMPSQQARMYLQNLIIGDFKFSGDLMALHMWDYL